jgi:hypothetical protein
MVTALAVSQLIGTAVLVATLAVVIWYTKKTSDMSAATREMAAATRDIARASQQQGYDQQRPLLVPTGTPIFQTNNPDWLDWQAGEQNVAFRNVGAGVALSFVSVLYGCESNVVGPIGQEQRVDDTKDTHWTCWLDTPVGTGETVPAKYKIGASVFHRGYDHIGRHRFNAPPQPSYGEVLHERASYHTARITATYLDVFGRKHASIFDYVQHTDGWQLVEFVPAIEQDLHDLEGMHE